MKRIRLFAPLSAGDLLEQVVAELIGIYGAEGFRLFCPDLFDPEQKERAERIREKGVIVSVLRAEAMHLGRRLHASFFLFSDDDLSKPIWSLAAKQAGFIFLGSEGFEKLASGLMEEGDDQDPVEFLTNGAQKVIDCCAAGWVEELKALEGKLIGLRSDWCRKAVAERLGTAGRSVAGEAVMTEESLRLARVILETIPKEG